MAKRTDTRNSAPRKRNERPRGASRPQPARGAQACSRSDAVRRGTKPAAGASGSPCPVDDRCGGCQNIAVPYADQLARKDARIAELFADLADPAVIEPIRGMDDPFRYRDKVMSPFAPGKKVARPAGKGARGASAGSRRARRLDREVLTGMYEPHSHRIVAPPEGGCLIENAEASRIIATIARLAGSFGIPPYKESTGAGFFRHAVIRVGHESGEILVTLVTNGEGFPNAKAFCRELVRRHPRITTVVQNVNVRDTNVVLGERERTLYGPGFILDSVCGLTFRISSQSFYQVNSVQTETLYRTAIDAARLSGSETVIDAYCGTGTIGLVAARFGAARVIGVESVESAVRDARENARHNGVENASFVVADAAAFMREVTAGRGVGDAGAAGAARGDGLADGAIDPASCVLFMDPPRAGASEAFLEAAAALRPGRIVYVSCDPTTQARDAAFLVDRGYRINAVRPVDMFPHTDHIECVVAFTAG